MNVKSPDKSERHFILRREKERRLVEGSQASPARPSDNNRIKMKMLGWLEAAT
jgi:hypothetical protein